MLLGSSRRLNLSQPAGTNILRPVFSLNASTDAMLKARRYSLLPSLMVTDGQISSSSNSSEDIEPLYIGWILVKRLPCLGPTGSGLLKDDFRGTTFVPLHRVTITALRLEIQHDDRACSPKL